MKKVTLFFILTLACFTSCTSVYFETLQPKDCANLKTIPVEIQGKWSLKLDTTIISANGYTEISTSTDSTGKIISVKRKEHLLSDSIILKKAGKYFVFNLLNENGKGYEIAVLDKQENGDINCYYPLNSPFFGTTKTLEVKKVLRNKSGKQVTNKSLKDVKGEGISEVHYKGYITVDDLKKIITPANKFSTLKKDGTISDPIK